MIEIENSDLDFEISGFVSLPELTRATAIISVSSSSAVISRTFFTQSCYSLTVMAVSLLMVGRFPLAVIHIHIDPYLADVNVHPTKQEVRISKEKNDDPWSQKLFPTVSRSKLDTRCLGKSCQVDRAQS